MNTHQFSKIQKQFGTALDHDTIEAFAVETGFLRRRRLVTPVELALAIFSVLGSGRSDAIADAVRTFNLLTGANVAYKPFHNQLAKQAFPLFMKAVAEHVVASLASRVLSAAKGSPLRRFDDIIIQDGTCFRVHDDLASVFPRRFGVNGGIAGVEVHTTMSLMNDQPLKIAITADTGPERAHLPTPQSLKNKLFLADRGYIDIAYCSKIADAGGAMVQRANAINPWIDRAFVDGKRVKSHTGVGLKSILRRLGHRMLDADCAWIAPKPDGVMLRVVSFRPPGRVDRVRLVTNLSREEFPAETIAQLYRLRWQIELLFKEMKSHTNLKRFATSKKPIVEGLIWAALAAVTLKRYLAHGAARVGRIPTSTLAAAKALRVPFAQLIACVVTTKNVATQLKRTLQFLSSQAPRAHPERDRTRGRLATGLRPAI